MKLNALVAGILLCGILAMPAWAGDEPGNPLQATGESFGGDVSGRSSAEIGLAQFEAAFPEARMAFTGESISRLYGSSFGNGSSPLDVAEQFRLNHADLFGVSAEDLRPEMRNADGAHMHGVMYDALTGEYKFTLVYYVQYRDGLPVYGSDLRLLVRNEANYPLVLASSTLKDIGDFRADTSFSPVPFEPAKALPDFVNFSEKGTVIFAGTEDQPCQPRIARVLYADNGKTDDTLRKYEFVCDRRTGEVLHEKSLIHFSEVTGSVTAMATPGAKADICTEEVVWTYPWARVEVVGGESGYADADGNFTLSFTGSLSATVRSYVDGLYFTIDNWVGDEEELTAVIAPGTPGVFLHNEDNDDDLVRSQTNIYTAANVCRDWVLLQNPSFPGISTETGVLTVVNRTDGYCPCNAWSDSWDGSINFCQAGSDGGHTCPNTAWQSVLNHEYGHHIIDFTSSGQGAYGEGMSDCIAMLPVDDPNLGYGFFGDCDSGLRTAENDCQWLEGSACSTCGSESHDCGQIFSAMVWDMRNELIVTEPDDYLDILSKIVVNSILVHTGTYVTPQVPIDFLTLDDDDGNIANGTPHYFEICAGFNAHGLECPELAVGMNVSPEAGFSTGGEVGGPFSPASVNYTIENLGPDAVAYEVTANVDWLTITNGVGSLPDVGDSAQVTVSINENAQALPAGRYSANILFENTLDGVGDTLRIANLAIGIPDDCGSAAAICPGTPVSDSTSTMTPDGASSCGTTSSSPDMWFKYTPGTDGTATFSLCSGTSYDSVLSVHSGCPGTASNEYACDDDGCGSGGGPSRITMDVTALETYYIRVTGWSGASGSFTLEVTGPDCGVPALLVDLPAGAPAILEPGVASSFSVEILDGDEAYVPGSGLLHYDMGDGTWLTAPLVHQSGDLYTATLPPASCSDSPRFYVTAEGDLGTIISVPESAPAGAYFADVGTLAVYLEDNFETDQGWTVVNGPGLTDGAWQRGIPAGGGDRGDPASDSDGSGRCYVTDNADDNSDVDGGSTYLISPVMDLAGVDADVSFDLWYTNDNGGDPNNDIFNIWISNNAGSTWQLVEAVGPETPGYSWITHTFTVGDVVTPTSQVQLRFEASDPLPGAVVEAGIDAVRVSSFSCEETCVADGDMNDSGSCNGADIQLFVDGLVTGTLPLSVTCHGDFNRSLDLDMGDVDGMVNALLGL